MDGANLPQRPLPMTYGKQGPKDPPESCLGTSRGSWKLQPAFSLQICKQMEELFTVAEGPRTGTLLSHP
jgi:hypothetical protein